MWIFNVDFTVSGFDVSLGAMERAVMPDDVLPVVAGIGILRLPRPALAVVLDMDGTLLDTERVYVETFVETVAPFGYSLPPAVLHGLIGGSREQFQAGLRAHLGDGFPYDEHRASYMALRDERMRAGVPMKAGVVELLDALDAGGIRAAIGTAATRQHAEENLARAGLRGRFQVVVTRDDVAHSKPSPDIFLKAAGGLGAVPENCLAVEDSHNGVRSAHAAGMMTVMVPDIVPANEEMLRLCVGVMDDLHAFRIAWGI